MTTDINIENFNIPEEMPENVLTTVHRFKTSEFVKPVGKRAAGKLTRGEPIQIEYHAVLEPLNIKYDSDPSMFDHNDDEFYLSVFRKDGQLNGKGSLIDLYKQSALKAGFPLTNAETAKALEGKVFRTERQKVTFMFDQVDPNTGIKAKVESKPQYVVVLAERLADDWAPEGEIQTLQRPRDWRTKTAGGSITPTQSDNSDVAIPELISLLDGATEAEYMPLMTSKGSEAVKRAPYIVEAATDRPALTARMVAAGMELVDGKLRTKVAV